MYVRMYVYVYVRACVCVYACMYVCIHVYLYVCIHVYLYVCIHFLNIRSQYVHQSSTNFYGTLISRVSIKISGHVKNSDLIYVWTSYEMLCPTICLFVCLYVCMHACMHACNNVTHHAKRVPWVKIFDTGCLADSGRVQSWEQYGVTILEIF